MHRVKLVLCTSDERYADMFASAAGFFSRDMIRTGIVRDVGNLKEDAEDADIPDMILMEPQMFELFCTKKGIGDAERFRQKAESGEVLFRNICILTEYEDQIYAGIDIKDIPRIYRYQDMEAILEDIQSILKSRKPLLTVPEHGTSEKDGTTCTLIGFYSPVRRTGQSTYARKLAEESGENMPVLYINLDSYSGDSVDGRNTLADLLYYFHQEDMVFQRILQKVTWKGEKFHQILPMPLPLDLWNTTGEQWRMLFLALKEKSIYRKIFIDFGDGRINGLFELLEMCDLIYMPIENDSEALHKLTQYERTLTVLEKGDILEKTRRVYLKPYGERKNLERTTA